LCILTCCHWRGDMDWHLNTSDLVDVLKAVGTSFVPTSNVVPTTYLFRSSDNVSHAWDVRKIHLPQLPVGLDIHAQNCWRHYTSASRLRTVLRNVHSTTKMKGCMRIWCCTVTKYGYGRIGSFTRWFDDSTRASSYYSRNGWLLQSHWH
jgi:hypothetical protein